MDEQRGGDSATLQPKGSPGDWKSGAGYLLYNTDLNPNADYYAESEIGAYRPNTAPTEEADPAFARQWHP